MKLSIASALSPTILQVAWGKSSQNLAAAGHEVCLITTKRALKPEAHPNLSILEITNTKDLLLEMQERVADYQVLIHSMAVSDYTPVYMTGLEEVQASSNLEEFLSKQNHQAKISSTDEVQVLFLKKTPKIISLVKEWNPTIHLIGFKLLVDVSEDYLIEIARKSLIKNQADLIIANDLTQISAGQHRAIFVEKDQLQQPRLKKKLQNSSLKKFKPIIIRKESYGTYSLGCNRVNRLLQVGRFSQFSKKQGHQVTVLMTRAATEFIQPLTLQVLSQNPVHLDVMKEPYPNQINHIELGKKADLFIVAPATANTIAKLAHGYADNMVTSIALALPKNIPKLIAPAMNTKMYDHPATQTNLKTLETYGYQLIAPRESLLACGDHGRGALADLTIILERIEETLDEKTL